MRVPAVEEYCRSLGIQQNQSTSSEHLLGNDPPYRNRTYKLNGYSPDLNRDNSDGGRESNPGRVNGAGCANSWMVSKILDLSSRICSIWSQLSKVLPSGKANGVSQKVCAHTKHAQFRSSVYRSLLCCCE